MSPFPPSNSANTFPVATAATAELRRFLLDLLVQGAYREGDFKLSSGQQSSYYIDCKQVTLAALGSVAIARLMLPQLLPETLGVAGLTLGADPIVSAVITVSAYEGRPLSGSIVRKEAKGHGTRAYVEGPVLPAGARVAVLEDVVTTGNSALKAVERLQAVGYTVDSVAIVDRQQGGAELYAEKGIQFSALVAIPDLQAHARRS
ncbi:MAG: orotate phosphoribosyltransferase [Cyanobacteria bacterium J06641_5]